MPPMYTPPMAAKPERPSPIEALKDRLPGESILDDLTEQLDRTRRLLTSNPETAADEALSRFAGEAEVEARIAADFAAAGPLPSGPHTRPPTFLPASAAAILASSSGVAAWIWPPGSARFSAAGVSRVRMRPWSTMASRPHSRSASSM